MLVIEIVIIFQTSACITVYYLTIIDMTEFSVKYYNIARI